MITARTPKSLWSHNPIPRGCVLYQPLWSPGISGEGFNSVDMYKRICTNIGSTSVSRSTYFDGTDDFIRVPHHASLNAGANFTVIGWINFVDDDTDQIIIGKHEANNVATYSYRLFRSSFATNKVIFGGFRNSGGIGAEAISTTSFTAGIWRMAAGTFDTANNVNVYVNGALEHSDNLGGDIQSTQIDLTIGAQLSNDGWALGVKGYIGETWLYGRTLTVGELIYIYNTTKWRYV